ncbi:hypothetical protein [Novosphingobium resinovorum]|uniref:Uncharacterized protein n=1 Tax=Novosphingobium resinovorum TaxID=158500 RepID=A0A031K0I0_9SPHN|nr:hypothetical protein [Novosphingobium resinovorum]AOR76048.1 hypothetical protein BES08_04220 [Novosphingobium resinovorum]EZP83476.1 hypothetical protein BV97_01587 [Novosphingobium resinovorum]
MNTTAMIVSMISIVGCLVLALRNPQIRGLGGGQALRLAAIWAAIIIALVVVIQWSGLRIG